VTDTTKRVLAGAALGVGAVALVAMLLAGLGLAGYQQAQPGAEHQRSAMAIRWIVLGEILLVLLACSLVVWRNKSPVARLVIAAGIVWAVSLFDFYFIALAGAVPR
jgi:low temperature requirement protein LtrA